MTDTSLSENKTDALAREALRLGRDTLLAQLRFLDAALSRLSLEPRSLSAPLATDGRALYYDARRLLLAYRAEHTAPARALLHCALHCSLRHFAVPEGAERSLWDLACDVAVERAIDGLGLPALASARDARQRKAGDMLRKRAGLLTAEKLYLCFLADRPSPSVLRELREDFCTDDHALWPRSGAAELAAQWREVSRRMQVDLETFAKRQGERAGALTLSLRAANREEPDYAAFLRRFATRGEGMKLDPDEFDYVFYTYGLRLYDGKVPLVEPMEYRDARRPRDFAVVTGFSESFPTETAERLLEQTRAGLEAAGRARAPVRTHILPGDAGDFRPAFLAAEDMLRRGAAPNLKGLLYLTDGRGVFPAKMPPWPAAFVFVTDDYSAPGVPPWAIRLALQRDDI